MTDAVKYEFRFGQQIWFTHWLERVTEYRQFAGVLGPHLARSRWKIWRQREMRVKRSGLVVGVRTLANGKAEHDYEAGTIWYPQDAERFTAYLVAYDFHKKPVYVLPEHLSERKFVDSEHEER